MVDFGNTSVIEGPERSTAIFDRSATVLKYCWSSRRSFACGLFAKATARIRLFHEGGRQRIRDNVVTYQQANCQLWNRHRATNRRARQCSSLRMNRLCPCVIATYTHSEAVSLQLQISVGHVGGDGIRYGAGSRSIVTG